MRLLTTYFDMMPGGCEVVVAESLFFVGKFSIANELKMTDFKNKIHKKQIAIMLLMYI